MQYQTIVAIMDRGKSGTAVQSITDTGSHSGTILTGRGAGLHEKQRILNVALEPEKDILLLVTPEAHTEEIITSINSSIHIMDPGQGILMSMQINRVHGI